MNLEKATSMITELMNKYLNDDWSWDYDNAVRRFGCCYRNLKKITISKHLVLLNDESKVRNTILHEIAHALSPRTSGHDRIWKIKCMSIGAEPSRLYDSNVVKQPARKFTGHCPNCGQVLKRFKRNKIACGYCCDKYNYGKYSPKYKIIWERI